MGRGSERHIKEGKKEDNTQKVVLVMLIVLDKRISVMHITA